MKKTTLLLAVIVAVCFMSCNNGEENSENIKLFPVKSGERWGYIDRSGKEVIAPQFAKAECFHEGLAVVTDDSGKSGFIDESGNYKIKPQYKSAGYFSEGMACVVPVDGKPEYINKSNDVKITIDCNEAGAFVDGRAPVMFNKKWVFIDKSGNMVGKDSFDYVFPFNEGMAAVMNIGADGRSQQWGYVDKTGAVVVPLKYAFARGFYEHKAYVSDSSHSFFINEKGKKQFDIPYDESGFFKNGACIVKKGTDFGFIDGSGKTIITPLYKDAGFFAANGLTNVKDSSGKWGFIDKTGKYVIQPAYDGATSFYGNVAFIVKDDKFGLVDDKGNIVLAPKYDDENAVGIHAYTHRLVETDYFETKLLERNWKLMKVVGADGTESPDSLHVQYRFNSNNFFIANDNGTGYGTYDINKAYRIISMSDTSQQTESFVIEKLTPKELVLHDIESQDKYVFQPVGEAGNSN